jgi:hypothetical protein
LTPCPVELHLSSSITRPQLFLNDDERDLPGSVERSTELADQDTLAAPAYEAFSAMLRFNTSLELELPPLDTAGGDQRVLDSHNQMRMEQRLNEAGRGRLLASCPTRRRERHGSTPYMS